MSRIDIHVPVDVREQHEQFQEGVHVGLVSGFLTVINAVVLKSNDFQIGFSNPAEIATTALSTTLSLATLAGACRSARAFIGVQRFKNLQAEQQYTQSFVSTDALMTENV